MGRAVLAGRRNIEDICSDNPVGGIFIHTKLPIALQRTYDQIIWWCAREGKDEFLADDVGAPRGHLRALANRGEVRRKWKAKGRGGGSPHIWMLIRRQTGGAAVLFDLDGTLIESFHIYHAAVNDVLSLFDISCTYDELFVHAGAPGEELYTYFLKKHGKYDISMKDELKNKFDTKFLELLPGVSFPQKSSDVITELKSRGHTMAICTGASREFVNAVFPVDILHLFSSIVTCDDVSACKPDPETFLKASDDIETHPSNCVVVGDGTNDLVGAARAGMRFILVRNVHNTSISEGYTAQIDDITELLTGAQQRILQRSGSGAQPRTIRQ